MFMFTHSRFCACYVWFNVSLSELWRENMNNPNFEDEPPGWSWILNLQWVSDFSQVMMMLLGKWMPQLPVLTLIWIDNNLFDYTYYCRHNNFSWILVSTRVAPTYFDATSDIRSDNLVKMADERAARRNRLEQRALQRRLSRKGFGKTIGMGIFIGKAWLL